MQRYMIPILASALITPIRAKVRVKFLCLLIVALLLESLALPRLTAEAHDVTVTLDGLDSITETLLPVFIDYNCYGQDRDLFENLPQQLVDFACHSVPSVFGQFTAEEPVWDCKPVYEDSGNVPDELADIIKDQEPDLEYGQPPKVTGWQCAKTGTSTVLWNPRFNCRDWTAFYSIDAYLPVDSHTFEASFDNNGGVNIDFDLSDATATITLLLVGERVDTLGCNIVHPFEKTMIYAVDIDISGLSGSVDVSLASDTNSTVYIESIDTDTLTLALDENAVEFDTVTNNRVDEVLLGSLFVLPGVSPLIQGIATLAWFTDVDVVDVVDDLAAVIYGWGWGDGCGNTEDCLIEIAKGILSKDIDMLIRPLNTAIATPLTLPANMSNVSTTTVTTLSGTTVVNNISTDIDAQLTGLTTSRTENTLTATWDVAVTPTTPNSGTCATGLTGFVAPPPGSVTPVDGDVVFTVPFDLIGEAVHTFLQQLNFCNTPFTVGAFNGQITPNGSVTVTRGGSRRIDLILPATFNATNPNANGAFTFNINMHTRPDINAAGDIVLNLTTLFMTNLVGTINTTIAGGVPALYSFGLGGATVSVAGAPPVPAPTIGPNLQAGVNAGIAPFFPIPLVQRSTVYVVPHVYIEPHKEQVDTGSFSLGVDIKDGSRPTDVEVTGVAGTAPYTDGLVGAQLMRTIPLNIMIKNKHASHVAPPTDFTISVAGTKQVLWLPTIEAGEEFEQPYTIQVPVNASGSVIGDTLVTISADINETTIIDDNRDNNVYEFVINDAWFQPDYTVEIGNVNTLSALQETGETIINYYIVSTDFTIPVTVRNIGTEGDEPSVLHHLKVYVNREFYGSRWWVGGLEVGAEMEQVLEIHVPDGPDNFCNYKIEVEIETNDAKLSNNDDFKTIHVESSSCIGSGPNDGDLQWIEEHGTDVLEDRFDGLEQEEWYTDSPSNVDTGSRPPILDQQDPIPQP